MGQQSNELIQKIQDRFLKELIALGVTEQEAIKISSTFFFAWIKRRGEVENINENEYEKDVNTFISSFKESLSK